MSGSRLLEEDDRKDEVVANQWVGNEDRSSLYQESHHMSYSTNTQYEFHRPSSVKRKKKIMKLIGIILAVGLVTSLCLILVLYLPRAPSMEIVDSRVVYISLRNFTAIIEDTIQVENRNFASIELESYEFYLYHNGTVVGMGSQTVEPHISKRSIGNFTAEKVLEDSEEYPQLAMIVEECNTTGWFTLQTEAVSRWRYFFSSRSLVIVSTDVYHCNVLD